MLNSCLQNKTKAEAERCQPVKTSAEVVAMPCWESSAAEGHPNTPSWGFSLSGGGKGSAAETQGARNPRGSSDHGWAFGVRQKVEDPP